MATYSRVPIKPCGIGSVAKREGGAATSESWARGAILIASSGYLAEASDDPTAIVGVALHAVSSAAQGAVAQYIPATSDLEFIGTLDSAGSPGTHALVITNRYVKYGLSVDASGIWYIDVDETSDALVRVIVTGLVDQVGDIMGRVRFRFLNGPSDLGGTPATLTIYGGTV